MKTTAAGMLLFVAELLACHALCHAQEAAPEGPPKKFPLVSTQDCFNCHFTDAQREAFAESRDFCHIETAAIWQHQDKHSQSLALLLTGEGRKLTEKIVGGRLEDVLRCDIMPADPAAPSTRAVHNVRFLDRPQDESAAATFDGHVATLKACFACHAPVEERVVGDRKHTTIENGVSCQACHGPGLAYEGPHRKPLWRLVTAVDKEREFGLRDLRNPVRRIELCASCHVGTQSLHWGLVGENSQRLIRHEWYALGHPPLPGLEYVTFAAQQPAHWRTIQEKLFRPEGFEYYQKGADPDEAREFLEFFLKNDKVKLADSYLAANPTSFSGDPTRDMARAKEVLISGLGVLATYAELVGAVHAKGAAAGPEFAVYDCTACHHELRSDFPTEVRVRRPGIPGRPPPAFWTLALARLGAAQAKSDLEPAIARLDAAFSARPFGDPESMQTAAKALADQCWAAAATLAREPLDNPAATQLLVRLVHPEHDVDRDYHAARQYAWAIREVMKDLSGVPHRNYTLLADAGIAGPPQAFVPPPLVKLLGGVEGARVPAEHEEVRRRIDAIFDNARPAMPGAVNWHMPLRLKLPAGQEQQVIANLPDWLAAIATYDSAEFRAKLAPLQKAYPRQ
jgi:hypothetical protein